ncbi:S-adenosyl-L-methionine-dependent methyltransferase, partial [Aureobasidium melanogenum]
MADEPAEGESISLNHAREQTLEADSLSDNDSALGDDTQSTTTSLSESIYNYRQEHGRTYHSYKDGQYVFPNDEREQDRLDLQHHMCNLTYRRLHLAPLEKPRHALDIGTGTGIWAMDFADQYPECQVIGIDLSPSQPTFVPPNLKYIIDDAEELWVYDHRFDYVHCRLMAGCFADPEKLIQQAFDNLEPGGYLEF